MDSFTEKPFKDEVDELESTVASARQIHRDVEGIHDVMGGASAVGAEAALAAFDGVFPGDYKGNNSICRCNVAHGIPCLLGTG